VGSGPRHITQRLGIDLKHGRIPVDEFLRVRGAENIWALGDAASIPLIDRRSKDHSEVQRFAPPTAQFAVKEARCVAKNLLAVRKGDPPIPFRYKPRGALASIGNYKGVAEIFGISFSGLLAWLTWRALYIGMLPGFSTRLRVALNWLFDYFLPRSIVQIANRESGGAVTRRFAAGDIICGPGQRVDGFYTVLSGCLESRIPLGDGQEDFVRILGEGDHWGERSLTADALTQGTLVATEDAQVLVLAADDFRQLRNAFPALDEYLHGISDKIYAPPLRGDQEL
jgi:NADH dehydrogenase